jgi:hypothetical protein
MQNVRGFVFIILFRRAGRSFLLSQLRSFGQGNSWAARAFIEREKEKPIRICPVMLSEAKHLWSNALGDDDSESIRDSSLRSE